MAQRAQRICRLSGCNKLTRDPSGYCKEHVKGHRKQKGDFKQADKFYTSSRWRKLADWFKHQHPLCQACNVRPSIIVHHIVEIKQGGDPMAVDNLQAVCRSCHNTIHRGGPSDLQQGKFDTPKRQHRARR